MLNNHADCFPEPYILAAFSIFDLDLVPCDLPERKLHGNTSLAALYTKVGSLLTNAEQTLYVNYQALK